jgi:anti-anti-sigma factor
VDAYLSNDTYRIEIVVRGEVDLANAETLLQRLILLAHPATGEIILDLASVTFMDCAGLHAVAAVARHAQARGGSLCMGATSPAVARLFRLSGFHLADAHVLDIPQPTSFTSPSRLLPARGGDANRYVA